MFIKKLKLWMIAAIALLTSNVFAGSEDWTGTFLVKAVNCNQFTVVHTPNNIQFMFFNSVGCLFFGKDSSINGLKMPQDVNLCTKYDVDEFTAEIEQRACAIPFLSGAGQASHRLLADIFFD